MQNQTPPVAFTTARVPNGPLQKVFEQDGYRWTEGGNGTRHFRRSDCDIVPGRVAVHFVPQRAVLLGPYPGVKADASCVLATCEEPLALEVWVADRAKPDFATADTKFFEEAKRALELRCKAPVFPRHIIAVVDGFLPDGDEMWTGAGGGCVISPARAFISRRRLGIDPALGGRGEITPAARVGGVGDCRDGRRFRGTNTPRPKINFGAASSSRGPVRSLVGLCAGQEGHDPGARPLREAGRPRGPARRDGPGAVPRGGRGHRDRAKTSGGVSIILEYYSAAAAGRACARAPRGTRQDF